MQSELHERLEYLVNYSSQLIFVSGESIAQQQKTLEAFVFQQHDDTEIAYLTAQENMEPSDYRRQLCRQLIGQVVGSFVRPLNELLSGLNSHEGPILIAITQAHNLPDALLQELWDLVLQSRFAGNKQHLNVLLFANNAWAERAKQWLPAKNTETPLIISSQSVISEQPSFESELDKMIASRREAFQAHLENRQRESTKTFANPLKAKWFYAVVTTVFFATFAGLIYWQYGEKLSSIFSPISEATLETKQAQVVPGSAYSQLIDDDGAGRNIDPELAGALADPNMETGNIEVISSPQLAPNPTNGLSKEPPSVNELSSGEALITNWENAVSTLPDASSPLAVEKSSNAGQPSGLRARLNPHNSNLSNAGNDGNSDITQNIAQEVSTAPTNPTNTLTHPRPDVDNQGLEQQTQWITANDYAIQMLAMKSDTVLKAFLRENDLTDETRIYKTERYGGDWFVVVFREVYSSLSQAQQARAALPEYQGKQNAFIKRGNQVLLEINKAQN